MTRFKGLQASSPEESRRKAAVRSTNTRPEILLRSALWKRGLRYRINYGYLPGKPDIVFPRGRVAVFCDGDFWHGRSWVARRQRLSQGHNAAYWVSKIESNMKRDKRVNASLRSSGWTVLRVWETEVLADPEAVADQVAAVVEMRRS
jgi:DNA mismatch endonuclease, patch repair protein